jgi:hypothetical protein
VAHAHASYRWLTSDFDGVVHSARKVGRRSCSWRAQIAESQFNVFRNPAALEDVLVLWELLRAVKFTLHMYILMRFSRSQQTFGRFLFRVMDGARNY